MVGSCGVDERVVVTIGDIGDIGAGEKGCFDAIDGRGAGSADRRSEFAVTGGVEIG